MSRIPEQYVFHPLESERKTRFGGGIRYRDLRTNAKGKECGIEREKLLAISFEGYPLEQQLGAVRRDGLGMA